MKSIIIVFFSFLFIIIFSSCATDNQTLIKNQNTLIIYDSAYYQSHFLDFKYDTITETNGNVIVKRINKNNFVESIETFKGKNKKEKNVERRIFYPGGEIKEISTYWEAGDSGKTVTFYRNGIKKRDDFYKKNSLISGKCFDSLGNERKHTKYENSAQYGMFNNCLAYPEICRKAGLEAFFIINLYISETGKVIVIKYDNRVNQSFINSALHCFTKIAKYYPATCDDEPVGCWLSIPVNFYLR